MIPEFDLGDLFLNLIINLVAIALAFLAGMFLARGFARRKKWDPSLMRAFLFIIPGLIIDLGLGFFLLFIFGPSTLTAILIAIGNLLIAIPLAMLLYKGKTSDSILMAVYVFVVIFLIQFTIGLFINLFNLLGVIFATDLNTWSAGLFMFLLSILIIFAFTWFLGHWGDRMQLVTQKSLISISSILPGLYYVFVVYLNTYQEFINGWYTHLAIGFVMSLVTLIVLKQIAYKQIPYTEIRGLVALERDIKLLELKDLRVYYPLLGGMLKRQIGAVKAVDGISIDIKSNETVGLVGESGCGKTTVALAVLGLVAKTSGEILFHGKPIPEKYSKYLRQKIQIVFQDPDASLNPHMKVVDVIAEPLKNLLGITKDIEIRKIVLNLLDQVSLKREHMDRYPHEFSGGQKQRIVIARALACNPELIILDEPTSALDVSVQAQILNLLKELQKQYGYGFMFITHNLAVVNHIADRVAVMYLGKIVEVGETDQIFLNPTHPYTQALLASRSEIDMENREISFVIHGEVPSPIAPPPGCAFNPRCTSEVRSKECMVDLPHKIEIEEGHYIWCINPPLTSTRVEKEPTTIQNNGELL